jgi:hypothetical protein
MALLSKIYMNNFRTALTILALILALGSSPSVLLSAGAAGCKDITLTWSDDPMTTQTVSWKSDASAAVSSISYEIAGSARTAIEKTVPFEKLPHISGGDAADGNFFSVTLTGLRPGTKYIYTISSQGVTGSTHTFTTEQANVADFKFLVFGDSQSGNKDKLIYQPWQETVHRAFAENFDARFFMVVGDLVEIGQSYAHWESWFEAARGVIDTIPVMPSLGNHEMYSNYLIKGDSRPVYYLSQFKLPVNGPGSLKGQVYSFDYGCAHFVVLDSQEDEELPISGDILREQSKWLAKDLEASRQPWKLVFFHKPPYNNKKGRPNPKVKAAFCPVFDKHHVDVVFNGHEHAVYRTYPIKGAIIQQQAKDGTIYYTTGRSGAKFYNDVGPTRWDAFSYNPNDQPCYETVQVGASKLAITAYKQDGTVIDLFVINKNK